MFGLGGDGLLIRPYQPHRPDEVADLLLSAGKLNSDVPESNRGASDRLQRPNDQVTILTDDLNRAAAEIIRLMFQRWVQENDFKYLDKHFGINQITRYRSIEYGKLKGQAEDREVKSVARKALDLSHKKEIDQLKRNLLAQEQAFKPINAEPGYARNSMNN